MYRSAIAASLVLCLAAAPSRPVAAGESIRPADADVAAAVPAKRQNHKQNHKKVRQTAVKKPKQPKHRVGDARTVGADPLADLTRADPSVSLKTPARESPLSLGARWSVSNDPNYGLGSTTTQTDILKEDIGQTPSATRNKFDLGVDYKF